VPIPELTRDLARPKEFEDPLGRHGHHERRIAIFSKFVRGHDSRISKEESYAGSNSMHLRS
jgi:hypothetical protein